MTTNPYKAKAKRKVRKRDLLANKGRAERFAAHVDEARADMIAAQAKAAQQIAAPNEIDIAEKAHLAFELRRRGASYTQIARIINAQLPPTSMRMTRGAVCDLVTTYVRELDAETREDVAIVKRVEVDRLDALLFGKTGTDGLFEHAREGKHAAIDRFLAVQRQRLAILGIPIDKLILEGGDKPIRIEDPISALVVKLRVLTAARAAIAAPAAAPTSTPAVDDDDQ